MAPSCISNHKLVDMTTYFFIDKNIHFYRLGFGTFVQIKKECQRLHKNYHICTNHVNRCYNTVALQYYRISSLVYTMQFCKQWCYTNTRKHLQLPLKCIFKDSLKVAFFLKMNNKPPMTVFTLCEENSGSTNYS